jgi:hypothetical protein
MLDLVPYWLEFVVVYVNSRLTWWKPGSSGIAACGAGAGEQEGGCDDCRDCAQTSKILPASCALGCYTVQYGICILGHASVYICAHTLAQALMAD